MTFPRRPRKTSNPGSGSAFLHKMKEGKSAQFKDGLRVMLSHKSVSKEMGITGAAAFEHHSSQHVNISDKRDEAIMDVVDGFFSGSSGEDGFRRADNLSVCEHICKVIALTLPMWNGAARFPGVHGDIREEALGLDQPRSAERAALALRTRRALGPGIRSRRRHVRPRHRGVHRLHSERVMATIGASGFPWVQWSQGRAAPRLQLRTSNRRGLNGR